MSFCRVPLIIDKTATVSDVNEIIDSLDDANVFIDYTTMIFSDSGLYVDAGYVDGQDIERTIEEIRIRTGHVRIDSERLTARKDIAELELRGAI